MSYNCQNLTELPPLLNSFKELYCYNNRLIMLHEHLPDNLEILVCYCNRLSRLPEHLPSTLRYLHCYNNRLIRLPEHLPNTLIKLWCSNNRLTHLPELPNSLTTLYCDNNSLTCLPEQLPNSLTWLSCFDNPFLFNLKNNLEIRSANPKGVFRPFPKWFNQNITSFNNYKVLGILQKSARGGRDLDSLGGVFQRKIPRNQKKKITHFCRDINRLCNNF